MKPRCCTILNVIALLLAWGAAGATLNVAVAWGCAAITHRDGFWIGHEYSEHVDSPWVAPVADDWNPYASKVTIVHTFVATRVVAWQIGRQRSQDPDDLEQPHAEQVVLMAGLPFRSMGTVEELGTYKVGFRDADRTAPTGAWRVGIPVGFNQFLPLQPLWRGFAINTLFYAGVLWMLFCGPFALRRMIRRRRGRCPHCGYPIGQSPVCTECGAAVPAKAANA